MHCSEIIPQEIVYSIVYSLGEGTRALMGQSPCKEGDLSLHPNHSHNLTVRLAHEPSIRTAQRPTMFEPGTGQRADVLLGLGEIDVHIWKLWYYEGRNYVWGVERPLFTYESYGIMRADVLSGCGETYVHIWKLWHYKGIHSIEVWQELCSHVNAKVLLAPTISLLSLYSLTNCCSVELQPCHSTTFFV